MKTFMTLFLAFITNLTFGQVGPFNYYTINFEDTSELYKIEIDTLHNPDNCWQIGKPNKLFFDSAYSVPNAIVTDTVNPYPANDTSYFIIRHIVPPFSGFEFSGNADLYSYYKVDSDSLNDFGYIEFSHNNGATWINLQSDTIYNQYWNYMGSPPVFTGNSGGWKQFKIYFDELGPLFNIQEGDTLLFRFAFISDSIENNRDGLMFDNIKIVDTFAKIKENKSQSLIKVYPNPSHAILNIELSNNLKQSNALSNLLELYSSDGRLLLKQKMQNTQHTIDLSNYKAGIYFIKVSNRENYSVHKVVVR